MDPITGTIHHAAVRGAPRGADSPDAAQPVSGASARLRALAALSGSLTDALTPSSAADLVEQKALSALGATSAVVVTLGAFPPPLGIDPVSLEPAPKLHVVHAIGLPAEVKAALEAQPLDAPLPFAEVARNGEPLFLESDEAFLRYAAWGASMILAGAHSAAVVPVWANGDLRGVLGLSWPEPHEFDEDECAFVLTLGVMCAQAIMRAHLKAAEREARDAAERANLSKANFVATISHELRTPINAVIGYTDLLSQGIDGPINAGQAKRLGRMRASGRHLLALIEELLGYARIEAGEETVRPETVSLRRIVDESLSLVRPIADLKGLRLHIDGTTQPVMLFTDPMKPDEAEYGRQFRAWPLGCASAGLSARGRRGDRIECAIGVGITLVVSLPARYAEGEVDRRSRELSKGRNQAPAPIHAGRASDPVTRCPARFRCGAAAGTL